MTLDANLLSAIRSMETNAEQNGKTKRDRDDNSLLVQMSAEYHALFYPKRVNMMTNAVKIAPEVCVETTAMLQQQRQCGYECRCHSDTMGEDELGGTRGWQARRTSLLKPDEISEMGATHDDIKRLTTLFGDGAYNAGSAGCTTDVPPHVCTGHKSGVHHQFGDCWNSFTFPDRGRLYRQRTEYDDGHYAPAAMDAEELRAMKMEDHFWRRWKRNHVVKDWEASTCEEAYIVRGNGTGSVVSRKPLNLTTPKPG